MAVCFILVFAFMSLFPVSTSLATVENILQNFTHFSQFRDLFKTINVPTRDLTVFALNNSMFDKSKQAINSFDTDKQNLVKTLIARKKISESDFSAATLSELKNVPYSKIYAYKFDEKMYLNDAEVSEIMEASDGAVVTVNKFIFPIPSGGSILQYLGKNTEASIFERLLNKAGSKVVVDLNTHTTLFLPLDATIEKEITPKTEIDALLATDSATQGQIVNSHLVKGKLLFSPYFVDSTTSYETHVAGQMIRFGKNTDCTNVNGPDQQCTTEYTIWFGDTEATIVDSNIPVSNGVVHIINKVLNYKYLTLYKMFERSNKYRSVLTRFDNVQTFKTALEDTTLQLTFMPFNVDPANTLPAYLKDRYNADTAFYLSNHAIKGSASAKPVSPPDIQSAVPGGTVLERTANGLEDTAERKWEFISIGDDNFVSTNNTFAKILQAFGGALNGIGYAVDTILGAPHKTTWAYLTDIAWLKEFSNILQDPKVAYDSTLQTIDVQSLTAPAKFYTVFATNDSQMVSFKNSSAGEKFLDPNQQADILKKMAGRHIVEMATPVFLQEASTVGADGTKELATLSGDKISVLVEAGKWIVRFGDVQSDILVSNIGASNGVVHIIDKFLSPCFDASTDDTSDTCEGSSDSTSSSPPPRPRGPIAQLGLILYSILLFLTSSHM